MTGAQGQQLADGDMLPLDQQLELYLVQQGGPFHEGVEDEVAAYPVDQPQVRQLQGCSTIRWDTTSLLRGAENADGTGIDDADGDLPFSDI
jgi:hypothetical protein